MSMRYYGVDDYGLVLSDDDMKTIASKLCNNYSALEYDVDSIPFDDEVAQKLGLEYLSGFVGEAIMINNDGCDDYTKENSTIVYDAYTSDQLYYMRFKKYPTLFNAAYKDIDDMIKEAENNIGNYIPIGFSYNNAIRHIVGIVYG